MYKLKKTWSRERRGKGFHYIGTPRTELCNLSLGDLPDWEERLRNATGGDEELLREIELAAKLSGQPQKGRPSSMLLAASCKVESHQSRLQRMDRITDRTLAERNLRAPERLARPDLPR